MTTLRRSTAAGVVAYLHSCGFFGGTGGLETVCLWMASDVMEDDLVDVEEEFVDIDCGSFRLGPFARRLVGCVSGWNGLLDSCATLTECDLRGA